MESKSIDLLKAEVENIFGRRVLSSADCQNLSDEILRINGAKISFNTIRRFFSLLKAANQPSIYTLNVLANYCGFSSFDNFAVAKQQNIFSEQQKSDQILLGFLTLFFKKVETCKRNDSTYLNLVQHIILHLEHYPFIIDRFQREIAKTKNGQDFYFEQFVFIDKLNSYYGSGLQYYLKEKKTSEAQLFGHSLLCYQNWLTGNNNGVEKHYKDMVEYNIGKSTASFICARYFATQLYYANVFNLDAEDILIRLRQFYFSTIQTKESCSSINCFEVIISEALILTAKYEEAQFYIEEIIKKIKRNVPSYVDIALYENISLFKAIVFAHTGKKMKAYEILQDINPYKFSFLSRQYLNILYLSIKQLIKNNAKEQEQIRHLIQETGFMRMETVWNHIPFLSCNN